MNPGIGICTYNRPEMFSVALESVRRVIPEVPVYVYDDGSDAAHMPEYWSIIGEHASDHVTAHLAEQNRGVATAKNWLLQAMLDAGHDWLFLMEDDVEVLHRDAVYGYIRACEESGLQHLNFGWCTGINGGGNPDGPFEIDGLVAHFGLIMGGWSIYGRDSLLQVGLMDTNFYNAWEDVEISARLAEAGYAVAPRVPATWGDALGSENWVVSRDDGNRSTLLGEQTKQNIKNGRKYWRANKPSTYGWVFCDGIDGNDL